MSELPFRRHYASTRIVSKSAEDANRDLPIVIAFLLIGLLLALNAMLRFAEMGALLAQYNQF